MSASDSRPQSPATELAADAGSDDDSGPAPLSKERMSSRNSSAWKWNDYYSGKKIHLKSKFFPKVFTQRKFSSRIAILKMPSDDGMPQEVMLSLLPIVCVT